MYGALGFIAMAHTPFLNAFRPTADCVRLLPEIAVRSLGVYVRRIS